MFSSHVNTWWKSLKQHLDWRSHIKISVTVFNLFSRPLERYLSKEKLSRRNQTLKIHGSTVKMRFFNPFMTLLKQTNDFTLHSRLCFIKLVNFTWSGQKLYKFIIILEIRLVWVVLEPIPIRPLLLKKVCNRGREVYGEDLILWIVMLVELRLSFPLPFS